MPPWTWIPSEVTSLAMSVENALATGVSSDAFAFAAIDSERGGVADRAGRLGQRAHGEQHTPHVGMHNDGSRLRGVHCRRAALAALARIGKRLLGRAFGNTDALQANGEPRAIHHREHAVHPGILFTDEKAGGAAGVTEYHRTGRRAVNSKLVFDRVCAHVVACAERTVGPQQEFGNEKQGNPARTRRGIGQPRQHEMDDVFGEVMLAERYEDLLALDAIGPISSTF